MVRPPWCNNLNVRNGIGTEEEDAKIFACLPKPGTGNWTATPRKAGLRKCGKTCSRLKSKSSLRPDLRHESFTPQEEELIIRLHSAIGSRWLIIAQQLPGRTDNDVKNYWNTKLKKKLAAMGIDPVTHRPYSQILADYGNMGGGLPRARTGRLGSLNRDMIKTAVFLSNQEQLPFLTESFLTPNIKMEPTSEMKTNSIDLLTQLQSITLVKEASNEVSPASQFHGTDRFASSSSSSSSSSGSSASSCYATANDNILAGPITQSFSWRDFLLEDEILPGINGQELENQIAHAEIINTELENPSYEEVEEDHEQVAAAEFPTINDDQMVKNKAASDDGSFVDCMLDGDSIDMFLDFPGLLDEPFYYC